MKYYKPSTSGVRFKCRILWNYNLNNNIFDSNLVYFTTTKYVKNYLWKYLNRYKGFRRIDWYRMYSVIFYTFFTMYNTLLSSGSTLARLLNKSSGLYTLSNNTQILVNYFFLYDLRALSIISAIELFAFQGAQFARAAGAESIIYYKYSKYYYKVTLPSWKKILLSFNCRCLLGQHYNRLHDIENYGSAGKCARLNFYPRVSGLSMNAGVHPHGGKSGPGKSLRSPWGWVTN